MFLCISWILWIFLFLHLASLISLPTPIESHLVLVDLHVQVWHCPWTVEAPWCQGEGLEDPYFWWQWGCCVWLQVCYHSFWYYVFHTQFNHYGLIANDMFAGTLRRSCGVRLALIMLLSLVVFSLTRTKLWFTWRYILSLFLVFCYSKVLVY